MSTDAELGIDDKLRQAFAHRDAGELGTAETLFKDVLKIDPQNASAQKGLHKLRKGGKRPAQKKSPAKKRKARPTKKPDPVATHTSPADRDLNELAALYSRGQLEAAEKTARKLIKKHPRHVALYNTLGLILGRQGRNADAVSCLKRAVTLDAGNAAVHRILGDTLKRLDHLDEAAESYRRALALEPDSAKTHYALGLVLKQAGNYDDAVASYRRALAIKPQFAEAHNNLGSALLVSGRNREAFDSCAHALALKPDTWQALVNFAEAARHLRDLEPSDAIRGLLVRCFESPRVDSDAVVSSSQMILKSDLAADLSSGSLALTRVCELDRATGGLLLAHLRNGLITDGELEHFLGRIRSFCLHNIGAIQKDAAAAAACCSLLEALAHEAFLNEYVWSVDAEEDGLVDRLEARVLEALAGDRSPGDLDLCLLGSYRPLRALEPVSNWARRDVATAAPSLGRLLERTIIQPMLEVEIRERIDRLTGVDDAVSVSVRSQYEENPYPRWDTISVTSPVSYTRLVLNDIQPNRPVLEIANATPNVLIAGCGSGRQPVGNALVCPAANLLAVDLSRTSLAFAQRKATELGVENIRFAQADILKLGSLEDRFDIIECSGVLHHMAEPDAGLSVLLNLLKPGGLLNIGLYSAIARAHISRVRQYIKDNDYQPSLDGIRRFRGHARSSKHADFEVVSQSRDYYTTSAIRDLLFHVQEHVFTVPQLQEMMEANDLEFLGFMFPDPEIKQNYLKRFPDDPNCLNLGNWHLFEQENPFTFIKMYQFWCRKLP